MVNFHCVDLQVFSVLHQDLQHIHHILYDELNRWYEEQLRKQGFPTDEELHKEYDEYVKKIEDINYSQNANLHEDPVDFDYYKKMRLQNFSNKNIGDKPMHKKWHLNDEWIETDDDPIKEPKDKQL